MTKEAYKIEKTEAKVILYPKGKTKGAEGNISIEFNPE